MDKNSFLASGMVEKYILGLTTDEEDRIVERFMESNEDIKAKIFDGQDCLYENFKGHIQTSKLNNNPSEFSTLDALEKDQEEYTNVSPPIAKWLQYAVIATLAISTFYFWSSNQSLISQNNALTSEVNSYEGAIESIDKEKATLVSNEFILTHSATERVQLRGTNLSPDASLLAFYNPTAEVLMIKINKLPTPPNGKYYHMWADVNGEMIHVGSLSNDAVNLTTLSFVSQATSLNVTIEDLPDVEHPDVSQLALIGSI